MDRRVKAVWAICPIQNELCWCWGNESLPRIGWCGKIQFLCWWKQLLMEIGWGYYAEETDGDGEQMPRMPASSCSRHGGGWRWFWWGSFLFFCRLQSKQSEDTFQWNTQPRRRGSPLPWEQKRPETAETQNTKESAQFYGCDGHLSKLVWIGWEVKPGKWPHHCVLLLQTVMSLSVAHL